ncbi:unnamed protein product [Sympodiomycopsis kandeliae]
MKTSQILTITAGTVLAAGVGYAIYFDHKRQTDPAFRKQLKKDKQKTKKADKKQEQAQKKQVEDAIVQAVLQVRQPGVLPSNPQHMEQFFMENIQTGETLLALGPSQYLPAAIAFFKGIKVYPDPMSLFGILEKATPEPCLQLIVQLLAKDAEMGGGSSQGPSDPLAQLAGLAAQAPQAGQQNINEVDDEDTSAPKAEAPKPEEQSAEAAQSSSSGPPSQASSQEWDKLSGTSVGAADSDVTTTPADAPASTTTAPTESVESSESSKPFDFSASSSVPSPLFEKPTPLNNLEAAASGAEETETGTKAQVDEEEKVTESVQSESGV